MRSGLFAGYVADLNKTFISFLDNIIIAAKRNNDNIVDHNNALDINLGEMKDTIIDATKL